MRISNENTKTCHFFRSSKETKDVRIFRTSPVSVKFDSVFRATTGPNTGHEIAGWKKAMLFKIRDFEPRGTIHQFDSSKMPITSMEHH